MAEPASAASVSVVVPCWRAADTIGACIDSAAATGWPRLEVIAVDDASPDGTAAEIEAAARRHPGLVRLIRLDQNGGPARARNAGAAAATGEFLFFVDSDTRLEPDALTRFVARVENDGADAVCGIYHPEPLNAGAVPLYKALFTHYSFASRGVFPYETFNGACAGISAARYRAVGGYDERLRAGDDYENEELGGRLRRAGARLIMDTTIQVRHVFPDFAKLTRVYFTRVSLWVRYFLREGQFESGGPATAAGGVATASVPAMLGCAALGALSPWALAPAAAFALLWLRGYGGFFGYVTRSRPGFLAMAVLLNLWFSCAVTSGAAHGLLRALLSGRRSAA